MKILLKMKNVKLNIYLDKKLKIDYDKNVKGKININY